MGLREAITGTAARFGVSIEPDLVEVILADVNADANAGEDEGETQGSEESGETDGAAQLPELPAQLCTTPLAADEPLCNSTLADGPWSVILDQVANGVAVRMAVLYLLAGEGAGES